MTVIEDVVAADTVQFSSFSYHLDPPVGDPSDNTVEGFCVQKPAGVILPISSAKFNLPIRPVDLLFEMRPNPGGGAITWSIDQTLDAEAWPVHVTRVHGEITTNLTGVPGEPSSNCEGEPRALRARLESVPELSSLTVDTNFGAAVITNIRTSAGISDRLGPLTFSVRIDGDRWSKDACGDFWLDPGDHVRFRARIVNQNPPDPITAISCNWTIDDPTLPNAVTRPGFSVEYDFSEPGTYEFTAAVTARTALEGRATFGSRARFTVLTPDEAAARRFACQLQQAIERLRPRPALLVPGSGAGGRFGNIRYVDPLWDPTPDELHTVAHMLRSPYSASELVQLSGSLRQINKLATMANEHVQALLNAAGKG
jgi:hypothetical protein